MKQQKQRRLCNTMGVRTRTVVKGTAAVGSFSPILVAMIKPYLWPVCPTSFIFFLIFLCGKFRCCAFGLIT